VSANCYYICPSRRGLPLDCGGTNFDEPEKSEFSDRTLGIKVLIGNSLPIIIGSAITYLNEKLYNLLEAFSAKRSAEK